MSPRHHDSARPLRGLRVWTRARPSAFLLGGLLASCLLAGCAAPAGDRWFGPDKLKHFTASAAIGAGAAYAAREAGAADADARAAGITVVLTVGAGKELYDRELKQTYWSWRDMTWNLLGGLLGSLLVTHD